MKSSTKHLVFYLVLAPIVVAAGVYLFGNFLYPEQVVLNLLGSYCIGAITTLLLPGFPIVGWLAYRADRDFD